MTRAVSRLGSLVVTSVLVLAGAGAPPAGAATGFGPVVSWEGGVTEACWSPVGDADAEVRVRYNASKYTYSSFASGGLARVSGTFEIDDYTYSDAPRGSVGPVVSLTMGRDWYVYLLVGSSVGITRSVVVPVRSLSNCDGSRAGRAEARGLPAGQHAKRRCVSKKEFKKIDRGLTPAQVKKIVGAKGTKVASASYSLVQRFKKCRGARDVVVNYQRATGTSANKVVSRFR